MTSVHLTILSLPAAALLASVAGCARNAQSSPGGTVTGTVAYRERMGLPRDAVVQVQLSDVSRQDAAAPVLAETMVEAAGRQVRATIRSGGRLLYGTDSAAPVITHGNPYHVDLMLARVGAGPGTAAAELWGTSWRLTDLGGRAPMEGVEATLEFPERGRVAGRGSCNRFFGAAEVAGEALALGRLGPRARTGRCASPARGRRLSAGRGPR